MKRLFVIALLASAGVFAGCAEQPQTADSNRAGRTAGKSDTAPYKAAASPFTAAQWTAGDRTAWEGVLRTRSQAQNEYVRAQ